MPNGTDADKLLHQAIDKAQAMFFEIEYLNNSEEADTRANGSLAKLQVLLMKQAMLLRRARDMLQTSPLS